MEYDEDEEIEKALKLCRGKYQTALVLGHANMSGSDLQGKAANYKARYNASRDALVGRLYGAGVRCAYVTFRKKHELSFDERDVFLSNLVRKQVPNELYKQLVLATKTRNYSNYDQLRALVELALDNSK